MQHRFLGTIRRFSRPASATPKEAVHLDATKPPAKEELTAVWDQLQDDLIWDGALRDIYVENTSHEEWRTFLSWLLASHHVVEYLYGDEPRSLPSDPRDLFQQRDQPHSIRVNVGGAWLHSHCFTPEEIDLDFWPTEVKNPEALWDLILFLSQLATALGRDVIVTHEGSRETVFLVLHGGRYRSGD